MRRRIPRPLRLARPHRSMANERLTVSTVKMIAAECTAK